VWPLAVVASRREEASRIGWGVLGVVGRRRACVEVAVAVEAGAEAEEAEVDVVYSYVSWWGGECRRWVSRWVSKW
jgi:hypothetical protein